MSAVEVRIAVAGALSAVSVLVGAALGAAQQAAAQLDPSTVDESVRALERAGPWVAAILILIGALYLEQRRRTDKTEHEAELKQLRADNLQLQAQLAQQQQAFVQALKEDAGRLLQHSRETNHALGRAALSLEKLGGRVDHLADVIEEARGPR